MTTGLAEVTITGHFIHGAVTMALFTVALFFMKHYSRTRDRLLLLFGIAFALMGVERVVLLMIPRETESQSSIFLIRLLAFILIIYAIVDKNRQES